MPTCDTCALLEMPDNPDHAKHYRICGWQPRVLPEPVLHLEKLALQKISAARWITLKSLTDKPSKLPKCSCWQERDDGKDGLPAEEHLRFVGMISLNLQAMELTLRVFLLKAHKQFIDWPKPGDTWTRENYITNYKSLGQIIDDYHEALTEDEKKKFSINKSVVTVRDALAHGRLTTEAKAFPATLWKFEKMKDAKVPATHITLTRDWLTAASNNIDAQRARVLGCFKDRGYTGLGA
jgi:hypothetical protein